MSIFRFEPWADRGHRGEADRRAARRDDRCAAPTGQGVMPDCPFLASMGIYVFSRDVLHDVGA